MKTLLPGTALGLLVAGCCSKVDCAIPPLQMRSAVRLEGFSYQSNDSVLIQAYGLADSAPHFEATVPVTIDSFSSDTLFRFPEKQPADFKAAYVFTHLPTGKRYRVDGYKFVKVAYGCGGCGMNQTGSYVDELDTYEVNGRTVAPKTSGGYGTDFYLRQEW